MNNYNNKNSHIEINKENEKESVKTNSNGTRLFGIKIDTLILLLQVVLYIDLLLCFVVTDHCSCKPILYLAEISSQFDIAMQYLLGAIAIYRFIKGSHSLFSFLSMLIGVYLGIMTILTIIAFVAIVWVLAFIAGPSYYFIVRSSYYPWDY